MKINLNITYKEELFDYEYIRGICAVSTFRGIKIAHAVKDFNKPSLNREYWKSYLYVWLHDWASDVEKFDVKYRWLPMKIRPFIFKLLYKRRYVPA